MSDGRLRLFSANGRYLHDGPSCARSELFAGPKKPRTLSHASGAKPKGSADADASDVHQASLQMRGELLRRMRRESSGLTLPTR